MAELYLIAMAVLLTYLPTTEGYSNGNVRLIGGSMEQQGRVEIWYSNQWNTVCDDYWDINDATVVCQQLGYRGAVAAHQSAHFGQGSGQILLDDLHCTGSEASLLECSHAGINVHNCGHGEDASVTCGCGDPGTGSRLSRTLSGTAVGDTVTYTCQTGYILSGSSSRTCQTNGHWSGNMPTCAIVSCNVPSTPSNGQRTYRGRTYGDRVTFSCNSGYLLTGSSSRTCQSNGQWSGTLPKCVRSCGTPKFLVYGQRSYYSTTVGSRVTYTCSTGYRLTAGSSSKTCQSNGLWSGSHPTCSRCCDDPGTPTNGRRHITGDTKGHTVTYICNTGYRLSGSATRTCQSNGLWSGSSTTCSMVTCGGPANPMNGSVTANGDVMEYGSVIYYTCDKGFLLQGNGFRVCQTNGSWSGLQPSCQVVQCPDSEPLPNGHFTGNSTSYQSSALYECEEGYILIGAPLRTCEAAGQWSGTVPSCASSAVIIGCSLAAAVIASLAVLFLVCCLCKVCCRIHRKRNTAVSTALAMSAIGTDTSATTANSGQSIPKDEPEYNVIGPPDIVKAKAMPVVKEKFLDFANANAAVPSYASKPYYNEISCNARRVLPNCRDVKPSKAYASLDEAGIKEQGEYCTMTFQ